MQFQNNILFLSIQYSNLKFLAELEKKKHEAPVVTLHQASTPQYLNKLVKILKKSMLVKKL